MCWAEEILSTQSQPRGSAESRRGSGRKSNLKCAQLDALRCLSTPPGLLHHWPDWTGLQGRAPSPTRGYLGPAPDPSSPRCSRSIEATSAAATAPSAQGPGIAPQAAPQSPPPGEDPPRGPARAYPPRRLPGDSARGPAPVSAGAERGTRPCTGAAPWRRGCTQPRTAPWG